MDGVLVGALGAAAAVAALVSWLLLARPEAVAALLVPGADSDHGWPARHPALFRTLQWAAAGLTVLLGFLTGLALAFLGGTG
jgi:hypothetical protein